MLLSLLLKQASVMVFYQDRSFGFPFHRNIDGEDSDATLLALKRLHVA